MTYWAKAAVISGTKSSCKLVTSVVCQGLFGGQILLIIVVNDLDDGQSAPSADLQRQKAGRRG